MIIEQAEIKYRGKVIFERLVLDAQFTRAPKLFAEDEACFLYLTKGSFNFRTPTQLLSFKEGDAMLATCGNYYIEKAESADDHILSVIGAFFYPAMIKSFFESDLSLRTFHQSKDVSKISIDPLMKHFIEGMHYVLDHPQLVDENLIITKLKELIWLLSKSENATSIQAFIFSLFEPKEYDFKEIIHQNLFAGLTLQEWAKLTNTSIATFKRKFNDYFNESPAAFILQKRIEKAAQLLHIKTKPVAEIADECGFTNVSHFNRVFKKVYGTSPTAYRNEINPSEL